MENLWYYVIYPGGDREQIGIVSFARSYRDDLPDYARASREEFRDEDEAVLYARQLAKHNGKVYAARYKTMQVLKPRIKKGQKAL